MRDNSGKVFAKTPPYYCMVNTFASHSEYEISGRHMHILDDLVRAPPDHSSHTRHPAHAGPKF